MKKPNFDSFVRIDTEHNDSQHNDCVQFASQGWHEQRKPIGFDFKYQESDLSKKSESVTEVKGRPSFDFFGTTVIFPTQLQDVLNEIIDSKYILDLNDDWDGEGSPSFSKELYQDAIQFLIDYSIALFNVYNIVMDVPEINPCRNGSIDISWRSSLVRLLINFKQVAGETKILFYRDHYQNKQSNKGDLSLNNIDESFLIWMKFLK